MKDASPAAILEMFQVVIKRKLQFNKDCGQSDEHRKCTVGCGIVVCEVV